MPDQSPADFRDLANSMFASVETLRSALRQAADQLEQRQNNCLGLAIKTETLGMTVSVMAAKAEVSTEQLVAIIKRTEAQITEGVRSGAITLEDLLHKEQS